MVRARVHVRLKPGVLDPQGQAIQRALGQLGFQGIADVRQGKLIELDLEDSDRGSAETKVRAMCEQLLANPVIETYAVSFDE
ncbi:MAG TPA: phosphoribosylformylglycinamidine synthase subunit PurS [Geminicoccaceae bacterium]